MSKNSRVGRPGITVEEVADACDSLRRQGRKVGPQNVRLELGRGSFTTITRFLRILGHCPAKRKNDNH